MQTTRRPTVRALSPREQEVLGLMAAGCSNTAIERALSVSPRTVESHVRHVYFKLGLPPDPDVDRRVSAARLWWAPED